MGAKGKYNHDRHKNIVALVRQGNYLTIAAQAVGIDKSTFTRWMQRGEKESEEYQELLEAGKIQDGDDVEGHKLRKFFEEVQEARALAEAKDLNLIEKAAETSWQAAAWRLERRSPDRWGRRDRVQIGGDKEAPLAVELIPAGSRGDSNSA